MLTAMFSDKSEIVMEKERRELKTSLGGGIWNQQSLIESLKTMFSKMTMLEYIVQVLQGLFAQKWNKNNELAATKPDINIIENIWLLNSD